MKVADKLLNLVQECATMCELGSQGGMDGRWHCSAAQVEILLFQHADILSFHALSLLSFPSCIIFPPIIMHLFPLFFLHALLRAYKKMGTIKGGHKEAKRVVRGEDVFGCTFWICLM